MKFPVIRTALSAVAVVGLLAFTFTSAHAVDDPKRLLSPGDSMFALPASNNLPLGQLYSVDSDSGAISAVGDGNVDASDYFHHAAWNPVTKTAYALDWRDEISLVTVGLDGVITDPHIVNYDGDVLSPYSLAISPEGVGFVTNGSNLYRIELTGVDAGETTLIGDTQIRGAFSGLSFSLTGPTAGTLYGITAGGELYSINPDDASIIDELAPLNLANGTNTQSLQVASDGILWIQNWGETYSELWSVDPAAVDIAGSAQLSSSITLDGEYVDIETILIVPGVALPKITSPSTVSVVAGTPFSFTPAATATPAAVFTYTGTLPAGVTFVDGVLSGTIATAGTYTFTFVATNDNGATPQTFTITVAAAAIVFPITGG